MRICNMNRTTRHTTLLLLLCIGTLLHAQTKVTIDNPDTWKGSDIKQYVGQTIQFSTPFYVTNNYYTNQLSISTRRIFAPTNQATPLSNEYNQILAANNTAEISLTGVSDYHRMGERLLNLTVYVTSTSSLSFQSCTWEGNTRKELEQGYDLTAIDQRGEHTLLVCAMNCEYYLTEQYNTQSSMGPDSDEEHQKQRAKISKALAKINADIYGLVEVQQGQGALTEIASDLTKNTGRHFTAISDNTSADGTYTKSGFVYCSETVTPYGSLRNNSTPVINRKKTQAFTENATGERFLFSINHFKAKSGYGTGANADQGDGQGSYNAYRKTEAQSVLSNYQQDAIYYDDNDILIMGDLNAYAQEDPITLLKQGGMTDLHRSFHADSSYTYTFHGQAGYLDHALCNSTLYPQVTGMVAYHINSDEHDNYTYDKSNDLTMFRCSDHDPVLVGLKLDGNTTPIDIQPSINSYEIYYQAETPCIRNAEGGYYIIYRIDGQLVGQDNITSPEQQINNLTPGIYIVSIYGQGVCLPTKIIVR